MKLDEPYDTNNIFAKILRGEIPCAKVWQDSRALVFMDVFPQAPGHSLIVPKTPSRNVLDTAPDMLAHLMLVTQRVARASVAAFRCDGVRIMQFNGSAAGQTIPHFHLHVIPVRVDETLGRHGGGGPADMDGLRAQAAGIAANMG